MRCYDLQYTRTNWSIRGHIGEQMTASIEQFLSSLSAKCISRNIGTTVQHITLLGRAL